MHYLSVSFTHKNTDISIRERLAVNDNEKKEQILKLLKANKNILECMILSTCNRVEVFAVTSELLEASSHILRCMSLSSGVFEDELFERADIFEDSGAIHHLFSVASSLDSLVVGETQIVGQLRDAYRFSSQIKASSDEIAKAIEYATKCAARVRNETNISKNPISVSSVAVAKAKEIFGTLEGKNAIVIGAGEMGELAARHLIANGANVIIINRTSQRAEALVDSLGEKASLDSILKLKEYVNSYELIFSSTSSPEPIITTQIIKPTSFKRYFFDIAVPRDIDIKSSENISVYSVDDLEEIVKRNMLLREEQAQIAYSIVSSSTSDFFKFIKENISIPIIKSIRQQAKNVAERELLKALKKGYLKNSDPDEAYRLIHQVFKAFLHSPTMKLKELVDTKDAKQIASAMKYVFDIELKDNKDEI